MMAYRAGAGRSGVPACRDRCTIDIATCSDVVVTLRADREGVGGRP
jgi:hypothetical protein